MIKMTKLLTFNENKPLPGKTYLSLKFQISLHFWQKILQNDSLEQCPLVGCTVNASRSHPCQHLLEAVTGTVSQR